MHLCDDCADSARPHGQRFYEGSVPVAAICRWCGGFGHHVYEDVLDEPIRVNFGPHPSSCVDLEPFPSVIWDVNGYYADLGVRSTATKGELRRAYHERRLGLGLLALFGHHVEDAEKRLTFVFKQLLNPKVRAGYDATPLDGVFFDKYVMAWVVEQRRKEAAKRGTLAAGDEGESFEAQVEHLLNQAIDSLPDDDLSAMGVEPEWPYSLWRWRTFADIHPKAWLTEVARALRDLGETGLHFAVGVMRGDGQRVYSVESWDFPGDEYLWVAFIGEAVTPDQYPALADEAAAVLVKQGCCVMVTHPTT